MTDSNDPVQPPSSASENAHLKTMEEYQAMYQKSIDDLMLAADGTPNKSNFGANAILGVSMAVCRAGAKAKNIPLYKHIAQLANKDTSTFELTVPFFNVINVSYRWKGPVSTMIPFFTMLLKLPLFFLSFLPCISFCALFCKQRGVLNGSF